MSGTKGKSTTAALAAHLAAAAGVSSALAGNIGVPALELLDAEAARLTVLELSSYQIADLDTGPEAVLMTNLFREHTEWHGSEQAYRREKLRLLSLPEVRIAVLNAREPLFEEAVTNAEVFRYGDPEGWDAGPEGVTRAGEPVLAPEQLPLAGEHNALNLCGALAALEALDIAPAAAARRSTASSRWPTACRWWANATGWCGSTTASPPPPSPRSRRWRASPAAELLLIAGGQDRGQDYARLGFALARSGATVIGVPSTGRARGGGGAGGRVTGEPRRGGDRSAGGRRHRPRAAPTPARSCCYPPRPPASTTTATSSSAGSASASSRGDTWPGRNRVPARGG